MAQSWLSKTASEWIGGIKRFLHFPFSPETRPTEDYHFVNKYWTIESDSCDKLVVSVSAHASPTDGDVWIDTNRNIPVRTYVDYHIFGVLSVQPVDISIHTALCNAVSGSIALGIPGVLSVPYQMMTVIKTDASGNPIYLTPALGAIDGTTTVAISNQYESFLLINNAANWYTFNRSAT